MSQTYQNRRNSRWVSAFTNHNLPQRPRILPKPPPQLLLPTTPLFHPTRLPSRPHQESSSAVSAKCPSIPSQQRLNSLQVCVQAKKKKRSFFKFYSQRVTLGIPKAVSLCSMLSQALTTDDEALLESCLAIQEMPIVQGTVQRVSTHLVVQLLQTVAFLFFICSGVG